MKKILGVGFIVFALGCTTTAISATTASATVRPADVGGDISIGQANFWSCSDEPACPAPEGVGNYGDYVDVACVITGANGITYYSGTDESLPDVHGFVPATDVALVPGETPDPC